MTEYRIYKSPWKAIGLILLCSIFVFSGILMLNQPGSPRFWAWASIVFFSLGYPIGLFQLLDRRPQIIINEIGIFDRTTHKDIINWEIIQDAYLVNVQGQKFICLVVDENFEPSSRKGKLGKGAANFSKSLGFQELNISLGYVNVNAERLTQFILAMQSADRPNRNSVIKNYLPEIV